MVTPSSQPTIVVHGGAGRLTDDDVGARLDGCRRALKAGYRLLIQGASAVDAVETAVMVLENDPLFNAGTGAPLNAVGEVELDASIMDGAELRAGAVAGVQTLSNPIAVARRLLEEGGHVLLAGRGAEVFARKAGFQETDMSALVTERQRQRWRDKHGTVGCVALDSRGRCASATSTGGLFDKLPGRVGDSALIGAGTYADEMGAVSCTGIGEAIIRTVLGKTAIDLLHAGLEPRRAARSALAMLERRTGSEAGLVVVDCYGRTGAAHNAAHMPWGYIRQGNEYVDER